MKSLFNMHKMFYAVFITLFISGCVDQQPVNPQVNDIKIKAKAEKIFGSDAAEIPFKTWNNIYGTITLCSNGYFLRDNFIIDTESDNLDRYENIFVGKEFPIADKIFGLFPTENSSLDDITATFVMPDKQYRYGMRTPMVAIADGNAKELEFKNLYGGLQVEIKGKGIVKNVRVVGKQVVAGEASVKMTDADYLTLVFKPDGSRQIAIDNIDEELCEDKPLTLWFGLPPGDYESIEVDVYTDSFNDRIETMSLPGFTIERNKITKVEKHVDFSYKPTILYCNFKETSYKRIVIEMWFESIYKGDGFYYVLATKTEFDKYLKESKENNDVSYCRAYGKLCTSKAEVCYPSIPETEYVFIRTSKNGSEEDYSRITFRTEAVPVDTDI